ncbi:MAG: hypothetical protein CMG75_10825 [Candidatus Marinimicrobia bacterium]|jgi:YbgC/YbaW family acyl-CoA thioester hydrolase|nr:hypothetical protein [Candidatus Neomarinimicrobiota bacterium]|tara:strand:- start:1129 stop:1488 length:360 start_codon:yes stop_codon:yes gene_type:complete
MITMAWHDLDSHKHINHANYLTYLETSRLEYLNKIFYKETDSIIASMEINYYKQLSHPQELEIGQKVVKIGNKSIKILGGIFKNGEKELVFSSLATLVTFNYGEQKTCHVPSVAKMFLD